MTTMQIQVTKFRNGARVKIYKYADEIGDITPSDNVFHVESAEMAKAMVLSFWKANARISKKRISWNI